jgi:hypothetical protein
VRLVAVCVGSSFLAACSSARDADSRSITREVEVQLATARGATIPGGVILTSSSGPTREGHSVSAEWSFEAPSDCRPYLEQAEASLRRAGYEPHSSTADEHMFSKHMPGDAYRVRLAHEGSPPRRVTVTFWAGPD